MNRCDFDGPIGGGRFPTLLVKWLVVANEGDLHRRVLLLLLLLLGNHHDLGIRSHTGGPGKQAPNMIKLLRDQVLIGHPNPRRIPEIRSIKLKHIETYQNDGSKGYSPWPRNLSCPVLAIRFSLQSHPLGESRVVLGAQRLDFKLGPVPSAF